MKIHKLNNIIEAIERKLKKQKNSFLEKEVITYRTDMKTKPKKVQLGKVYSFRSSIESSEKYRVIFLDCEKAKKYYNKLLKEYEVKNLKSS